MRLAEFCGVPCESVPLPVGAPSLPASLGSAIRDDRTCIVVNPSVMSTWSSADVFPDDLASYLVARFPFLLVHNLDDGLFATSMLRHLSGNRLTSLQPAAQSSATYQVAAEHQEICGVFSGLEFGPINTANDRVFAGELHSPALQTLVAVGGQPMFAGVARDRARVFFLAGKHIADLDGHVQSFSALRYFSQLVPAVMFLRHVF